MAELIDKGATLVDMNSLLEELEDYIEYDTFDQYQEEPLINMSFETLEDVITSQPTVTEAEIRAKALNEVLEKVKVMNLWDSRDKDMFRLVVEQLKESE